MQAFCISEASASGVADRDEGNFGTSDPVLWVFQQRSNYETVQKTGVQMNTVQPRWQEHICLDFTPGIAAGNRPCFEIRDDYDPQFPPDRPPLLHHGCAAAGSMASWGMVTVRLSAGARLSFRMTPRMPAPPPSTPAPMSPPSPPPTNDIALRLNERFRGGTITKDLATAGVLIHQFDAMDDPNPDRHPWMPGAQHAETGDRISAALINAHMQPDPSNNIPIYSYSLSGIVLSPTANRLLCAFPYDVGSLDRHCWPKGVSEECIPGCSRWRNDPLWCSPGSDRWKVERPACAWRPSDLDAMMAVREEIRRDKLRPPQKMWNDNKYYSELIFDASYYTEHLPHSIEAVFYLDDNCGDAYDGPKCKDYGIGAQRAIAKFFHLDSAELPLLKLDLWNWNEPFTDVLVRSPPPTPPAPPSIVRRAASQIYALSTSVMTTARGRAAVERLAPCTNVWCSTFETWMNGADFKFFSMWNVGFQRRGEYSRACWDWPENNDAETPDDFFRSVRDGSTCSRNWIDGAWGANDRPMLSSSPALLGYDETSE